jgi:hypothetical protein
MSQLKVDTITNEAGTGSPSLPNGLTVGGVNYPTSGPLSNRNKIINGAMVIDQRNAGAAVSFPVGTGQEFPVDRWRGQNVNGTSAYSAQRVSEAPAGFFNSLKVTTTTAAAVTAADSKHFWLPIEGFDVADFGFGTADAKTVTLSFWVRSSVTGNHGGALSSDGAARVYSYLYNIAQANVWEYKTITVPGDTSGTWLKDNGTGLRVNFNLGSGSDFIVTPNVWGAGPDRGAIGQVSVLATSGATWQITGVQLEAGTVATPFEHRSFGQELALCQRYFTNWVGDSSGIGFRAIGSGYVSVSDVDVAIVIPLSAAMRTAPTVAFSGTISLLDGTTNSTVSSVVSSLSASNQSMWLVLRGGTALITGRAVIAYTQNATTSVFSLSAEL